MKSNQTILSSAYFSSLFIVNPFITTVLLFAYHLIVKRNSDEILFLCVLSGMCLGCINATKLPENDLIWYLNFYDNARFYSLLEFPEYAKTMLGSGDSYKEPVYAIFCYLSYYLTGGSRTLFLLEITTISYTFLNIAVFKFCKALRMPFYIVIISVFLMVFTPYIFTMSAQVLRQYLAASILLYVIVMRLFYNRRCWIWIGVMVLIHSTSLFFVLFLFLPFLRKAVCKRNLTLYILLFVALIGTQIIAQALLPFFGSTLSIGYALTRVSKDTTFGLDALSPIVIGTSILICSLPSVYIYFINKKLKNDSGIVCYAHILLILICFILLNLNQSELSVRFNFYSWMFFPLSFAFLLKQLKVSKMHCLLIFGLVPFFLYRLKNGTWEYLATDNLCCYTLFQYLIR